MALGAGLYLAVLRPRLHDPLLSAALPPYALLLVASVLAGWASLDIGRVPSDSAARMAAGLTLFFACDLTVGATLAIPPTERAFAWTSASSSRRYRRCRRTS